MVAVEDMRYRRTHRQKSMNAHPPLMEAIHMVEGTSSFAEGGEGTDLEMRGSSVWVMFKFMTFEALPGLENMVRRMTTISSAS